MLKHEKAKYFPAVGWIDIISDSTVTSWTTSRQLGSLIPSRECCPALLYLYLTSTSCTLVRSIARILSSQIIPERNHSSVEVNTCISNFASVCLAKDFDPAVYLQVNDCNLARFAMHKIDLVNKKNVFLY